MKERRSSSIERLEGGGGVRSRIVRVVQELLEPELLPHAPVVEPRTPVDLVGVDEGRLVAVPSEHRRQRVGLEVTERLQAPSPPRVGAAHDAVDRRLRVGGGGVVPVAHDGVLRHLVEDLEARVVHQRIVLARGGLEDHDENVPRTELAARHGDRRARPEARGPTRLRIAVRRADGATGPTAQGAGSAAPRSDASAELQ